MFKSLLFGLALTLGATAHAEGTAPQAGAVPDTQIAKIMLTINDGEIDAAKIAKSHAQNQEVKDFAKMMRDQHEANMKETKQIAKANDIKMQDSDTSKALKEEAKTANTDLKRQDKSAFDKAYIKEQIAMHEKALATLKDSLIPSAQNPAFKSHLEKTSQAVAEHLEHAKMLDAKL